jgi:hypothetical protein
MDSSVDVKHVEQQLSADPAVTGRRQAAGFMGLNLGMTASRSYCQPLVDWVHHAATETDGVTNFMTNESQKVARAGVCSCVRRVCVDPGRYIHTRQGSQLSHTGNSVHDPHDNNHHSIRWSVSLR